MTLVPKVLECVHRYSKSRHPSVHVPRLSVMFEILRGWKMPQLYKMRLTQPGETVWVRRGNTRTELICCGYPHRERKMKLTIIFYCDWISYANKPLGE